MQKFFLASLLLWCQGALAASLFSFSPMDLTLHSARDVKVLKIGNTSSEEMLFTTKAFTWEKNGHQKSIQKPTTDLIISPPTFKLKPGETQLIRVGSRVADSTMGRAYYVYVSQAGKPQTSVRGKLPVSLAAQNEQAGSAVANTQLKVQFAVNVAVFIQPQPVVYQTTWKVQPLTATTIAVDAVNTGNAHLQISAPKVAMPDDQAKLALEKTEAKSVAFPQQKMHWVFKLPAHRTMPKTVELDLSSWQNAEWFTVKKIATVNNTQVVVDHKIAAR